METQPQNQHEIDLLAGLAAPARRALAAAGVQRLDQLAQWGEAEVRQWHGIGSNALNVLRAALAARGLSFAAGKEGNMGTKSGGK